MGSRASSISGSATTRLGKWVSPAAARSKSLSSASNEGEISRCGDRRRARRSGAQLLLDDGRFDGELALDDAQRAAMRQALRADRNVTLDTAAGRVFVQVFSPPRRCFV